MYQRWLVFLTLLFLPGSLLAAGPIRLHPSNPHYFLFRGKPTILLTSGEHYGAVLNLDFDYMPYLNELQRQGFNLTRTFSGVYREVPGSFHIEHNTLGPKPARYCCPWARSGTPGAGDGLSKFDLTQWNPEYFRRLREFVRQAGKRGIVVELDLFCTIYDDQLWNVNPMNARNNVNGVGRVKRERVYTLNNDGLLALQDRFVRKILTELKDFDNVYYEVCNEPYFAGVSPAWSDHIVGTIASTEAAFGKQHLIAQNIANNSAKITRPNPHVSIFNFHYALPKAVAFNYALHKAVGDDETGFRGTGDLPYRTEGWSFLLAGGAVYDNLDYSFTTAHPDGTARVRTSPGGGGPALRRQLHVLKSFLEGFDFIHMKPAPDVIASGLPAKTTASVLAEPGKAYAIYANGGRKLTLAIKLPAGRYQAAWLEPTTGKVTRRETFSHRGAEKTLESPPYEEDIALRIVRQGL
ncbi:MAG TPA: DUF6298 domain-containing protein [Gemmataceae bacterium]|nr:DUF6298 domain-containing protein [Gemmataceae bacterium]